MEHWKATSLNYSTARTHRPYVEKMHRCSSFTAVIALVGLLVLQRSGNQSQRCHLMHGKKTTD